MNSFLKSAVCVAVAGACGFAAAGTIAPASKNVSLELLKLNAAAATPAITNLPVLSFVTGASYANSDELTLTLGAGSFSLNGSTHSDVSCGSNGNGTATLQFMNTSGGNATFRVTATSGTTSGISCAFNSLALLSSSITAEQIIKIGTSAKVGTTGSAFDNTTSANWVSVAAELGSIAVTTKFNGVVDYASKLGRAFTSAENIAGSGDALTFSIARRNSADFVATGLGTTSVKFSIVAPKGLSFLNNGGTTCVAAPSSGSATGVGATSAIGAVGTVSVTGADCGTVSFVSTTALTDNNTTVLGFALGTSAGTPTIGNAIQPQTFGTTTVTVDYGRASTSSSAQDVGTWTSNGQAAVIPYMPSNTSATNKKDVVVYITNRSSVTGTATATVYGNEVSSAGVVTEKSATAACTVSLGTIAPNSTTNVSAALRTGIDTCWGAGKDYRVAVEIQTTLPTSSTTVYSGFTVGTDRVNVINDTNGK